MFCKVPHEKILTQPVEYLSVLVAQKGISLGRLIFKISEGDDLTGVCEVDPAVSAPIVVVEEDAVFILVIHPGV